MSDSLTPQQRHTNMAAIHGKDTKPEMIVRRYLWGKGFRYRLNLPCLPGKPDIVLRKYRTCLFVNGCFWHGHHVEMTQDEGRVIKDSDCCRIPNTNRDFWVRKIARNQQRDKEVQQRLAAMGWHSLTVWECQLRPACREQTLVSLAYALNSIFLRNHTRRRYADWEEPPMMAAEEGQTYGANPTDGDDKE